MNFFETDLVQNTTFGIDTLFGECKFTANGFQCGDHRLVRSDVTNSVIPACASHMHDFEDAYIGTRQILANLFNHQIQRVMVAFVFNENENDIEVPIEQNDVGKFVIKHKCD